MMFVFSLLLAFVWSTISASLGLYALIQSNKEKSHLKAAVPPPTHVIIDTNDVLGAGASATAAFTLIAIVTLLPIFSSLFYRHHKTNPSPRALRILAGTLVFAALWLIASLIPYTFFFATRSARVTATIGSIVVPAATIQQVEQSLGATPVYRKKTYRAPLPLLIVPISIS
jgi:hypothetical protein